MKINRWWVSDPEERYWLEVSRRIDFGLNLKAPQKNEKDLPFWSYELVREVRQGDIVFHYDGGRQEILAASRPVAPFGTTTSCGPPEAPPLGRRALSHTIVPVGTPDLKLMLRPLSHSPSRPFDSTEASFASPTML